MTLIELFTDPDSRVIVDPRDLEKLPADAKIIVAEQPESEIDRWVELDATVQRGAMAFHEVEIRDGKLYRDQFDSWEGYCRVRLDWSISKANRLIGAANVIYELTPIASRCRRPNPSSNHVGARILA